MSLYVKSKQEVLEALKSNSETGLSSQRIAELQKEFGENRLREKKKKANLQRFFDQFKDVMIIILIGVLLTTTIYLFDYRRSKKWSNIIYLVATIIPIIEWVEGIYNIDLVIWGCVYMINLRIWNNLYNKIKEILSIVKLEDDIAVA